MFPSFMKNIRNVAIKHSLHYPINSHLKIFTIDGNILQTVNNALVTYYFKGRNVRVYSQSLFSEYIFGKTGIILYGNNRKEKAYFFLIPRYVKKIKASKLV